MSASLTSGQIVTFYSWKGGVGRTMALANTAIQLARKGKRVLVVDWDLEAPGLDRYFLVGEGSEKLGRISPNDNTGLIGILSEAIDMGKPEPEICSWETRIYRFTPPPADPALSRNFAPTPAELHLLPSGFGIEKYSQCLAGFSWSNFFAKARGGEWLENLRNQWREIYDFVLIDSRTGLTDSGGVCTVQMPDLLVLVFTSNEQSLVDGLKFVQSVQIGRREFAYDRAPLGVLPLLSRWDGDDEVDLGVQWLERMDSDLREVTASWLPREFTPRRLLEKLRVPHVARFSFGEPLPVLTHSLSDANLPGLAYECVAVLLASNLSAAGKIIDPSYEPLHHTAGYHENADIAELALVQNPVALYQEIARLSKIHGAQSAALADFFNSSAQKLFRLGRFSEAEPLMRRALEISEKSYDANHPSIAIHLNNLAQLLQSTNRIHEAEPLMRRALSIDESNYGIEHAEVAVDLNNLAQLLKDINQPLEAEAMMRRALAITESSFGPDHYRVADIIGNLAQLLSATNRLAEAEQYMRRALDIHESAYGPDHPDVARDLNNLAGLLKTTMRLSEAEPLMRRSLAILESSYGPDHPNVANIINNLAQLLRATGQFNEAETLMMRALSIADTCYNPDHPFVATVVNNLAHLLKSIGRLDEAEPLMRRSLAIAESSYGPDHPKVAIRLNNLAQLFKTTGRWVGAEMLMRRALAIDEATYGRDHPAVAVRLNNLAVLLHDTDRAGEAEPLMWRSLSIDESNYGPNHPAVAIRLNNIAKLLEATGRVDEAEPLLQRARSIQIAH